MKIRRSAMNSSPGVNEEETRRKSNNSCKLRLRLCFLTLIWLPSCSKPIVREDVLGEYVSNKNAKQTLTLRRDGTYSYAINSSPGPHLENTGDWEFGNEAGRPILTFNRFLFGMKGYLDTPGIWHVEVERLHKGLGLCIDADVDHYLILKPEDSANDIGNTKRGFGGAGTYSGSNGQGVFIYVNTPFGTFVGGGVGYSR
jgi:hypothetical protein